MKVKLNFSVEVPRLKVNAREPVLLPSLNDDGERTKTGVIYSWQLPQLNSDYHSSNVYSEENYLLIAIVAWYVTRKGADHL